MLLYGGETLDCFLVFSWIMTEALEKEEDSL